MGQQTSHHAIDSGNAPGAVTIVDHKPNANIPKHYHIEDDTFINEEVPINVPPMSDQLRIYTEILLARKFIPNQVQLPTVVPNFQAINFPNHEVVQYTWIGHSSFLVQVGGYNIMTDPVFRNRCSFFKHALGPKRVRPVPFTVAQLPPIDLIILSHNHTDHLDRTALCDIAKLNPKVKFYVPLRMKKWLVKNVKHATPEQFIDMDWWQEIEHVPFEKQNIVSTNNRLPTHVSGSLKVTFLPSQHWSVRNTINDWNHQLWGGFGLCYTPHLMTQQSRTIYFAGDTGYNNTMFKKIYERFAEPNGGIDVAFIPIGAYGPRWFSASQHADPMEAVQIAVDIGAKHSCGMHWGTFLVSTEPVLEPVEKLHQALQLMQLDYHQQPNEKESNGDDFFITVAHGQTKTCTHKPKKSHVDVLHGKDKDQNTSVILQMEKEK